MNVFFFSRTRSIAVGILFSLLIQVQLSSLFAKDEGCRNKYVIQQKSKTCKNCKQSKGKDCKTPWAHYYTNTISISGNFSKWYTAEVQVGLKSFDFEKGKTSSPDLKKYSFPVQSGYDKEPFSFGMVDTCGSFIVPPIFSYIEQMNGKFSLGMVDSIVSADKNKRIFYLINRTGGKYKRLPDMDDCEMFSPNLFLVKSSQNYGLLDTTGKIILAPEFNTISNLIFDNNLYSMDLRSYNRPYDYSDGWLGNYYGKMYSKYSEDMKRTWYSYCKEYDDIDSVVEKTFEKLPLILIEKDKKMGICDGNGKIIAPVENEKITYNGIYIAYDKAGKEFRESNVISVMKDSENFRFMHSDMSPIAEDKNGIFVQIALEAHKKHELTAEEKVENERLQQKKSDPLNFAYRVQGMFVVNSVSKDEEELTSSQFGNQSFLYIDRVNNSEIVVSLSPQGQKFELCHMTVTKVDDNNYEFDSPDYSGSWSNVIGHHYVTIKTKSMVPSFIYKAQM